MELKTEINKTKAHLNKPESNEVEVLMDKPELEGAEALEAPDYKKTKLGWIPVEWMVSRICDLTTYVDYRGKTPQKRESGAFLVTAKNIKKGFIDYESSKEFVAELDYNKIMSRGIPNIGDVLITTEAPFGNIAQVDRSDIALAQRIIKYSSSSKLLTNDYLKWFMLSEWFQKEIEMESTGSAVKGIRGSRLHKCPLILPPLPEQQKIAAILSTWDEAIEASQNLITQLKNRKKGLMQQLLTGATRLPGFDGEWEEVKGKELFSNHSDKTHNGELEVLSATQDRGVIPRSETGIDIKYAVASLKNYKKVEVGDYVISLRSFQGGIEYSKYEGMVSPAYTVLKEKLPISKKFYKEYMKTRNFITRLNSIIYGIRDGKQISYKEFGTLKFFYPPVEEQKAIAKVLNTADAEITQQENYLAALQTQKKGLMQQLLTGATRVKLD